MRRDLSTTLYPERSARRASPSRPVRHAALHSFNSFISSISFTSIFLRTLLHNGHSSTPLQSIPYALFLSPRGVYPPRGLDCPSPTPYPLLGPCKTCALRSGWFYGTDRRFRPCRTGSPFLSHA